MGAVENAVSGSVRRHDRDLFGRRRFCRVTDRAAAKRNQTTETPPAVGSVRLRR
jgi:hypothetical protein